MNSYERMRDKQDRIERYHDEDSEDARQLAAYLRWYFHPRRIELGPPPISIGTLLELLDRHAPTPRIDEWSTPAEIAAAKPAFDEDRP